MGKGKPTTSKRPQSNNQSTKSQSPPTNQQNTSTTSPQPLILDHDNEHLSLNSNNSSLDSMRSMHQSKHEHNHSHDDHGHNHDNHGHNHSHSPKQQPQTQYSSYQALDRHEHDHGHNHSHGSPKLLTTTQHDSNSNSNLHSHIVCSHTRPAPECGHNECHDDIDPKRASSQRVLKIVTLLCFSFMCVELLGGYLSGSLAIMTDAAHLLSDLVSFIISLLSITMASKSPTSLMTFGYHRVEILGALISILLIWGLTVVLVYESIHRIMNPDLIEVHGGMMLVVAIIGFCVNIIMGLVLLLSGEGHNHSHGGLPSSSHGHSHGSNDHGHSHGFFTHDSDSDEEEHGHSHNGDHGHAHGENDPLLKSYQNDDHDHNHSKPANKYAIEATPPSLNPFVRLKEWILPKKHNRSININAAILHVLGDLMQSVGVIIAALIIWFHPPWKLADPLCTLLFSVIVLTTTTRVMKQGLRVLMEGTPDGIDSHEVAASIQSIPGVIAVHDLHIWSLSIDQPALAVHLVVSFVDDDVVQDTDDNLRTSGSDAIRTPEEVLTQVNELLLHRYSISHTTIQLEEQHKSGVCIPKATLCKRPTVSPRLTSRQNADSLV